MHFRDLYDVSRLEDLYPIPTLDGRTNRIEGWVATHIIPTGGCPSGGIDGGESTGGYLHRQYPNERLERVIEAECDGLGGAMLYSPMVIVETGSRIDLNESSWV